MAGVSSVKLDMFGVLFSTKQMLRIGMCMPLNPLVGKEHVI